MENADRRLITGAAAISRFDVTRLSDSLRDSQTLGSEA
jgi:hypothetical protein